MFIRELDAGIKMLVAFCLSLLPFFTLQSLSLGILGGVLLGITLLARIKLKSLIKSIVAYGVIIALPYFFGLLIYVFLSRYFPEWQINSYDLTAVAFKLLQLFFIWYIGTIYLKTTPITTLIGLLDKVLSPLKLMKIPITDFLTIVLCIVTEISETAQVFRENIGKELGTIVRKTKWGYTLSLKVISEKIVSLIVNSFSKLEKIQGLVEDVNLKEACPYDFRFTWKEALAIAFIGILITVVFFIEKAL